MQTIFAELYSPSLELILLVTSAAANILLAYVVFRSNPRSATNSIFALLSIVTVAWLSVNYITNHLPTGRSYSDLILLVQRFGIFFAAPMSSLLFLLAHTIPFAHIQLRARTFYAVVFATVTMMTINISPLAFPGIELTEAGPRPTTGPGLLPFSILSTVFSILAIYYLIRKYRRLQTVEKQQVKLVLIGMLVMLGLIIATVLIPLLIFGSVQFLVLTPIYTLIFLGTTAYAITKYQLFDIKVLVTEALTLVMTLVLFAKLFGEDTLSAQVIDSLLLLFMMVFGYFLVRSVRREVKMRETIEVQAQELEVANAKQVNLLHFISHEIKGYLTKSQAAFATIAGGDLGVSCEPVQKLAETALVDVRKGVNTVMDILDASNLQKGTISFESKQFDFAAAVDEIVHNLRAVAAEKGLTLNFSKPVTGGVPYTGDEEKIRRHVIRNLIDNSIRYTESGAVDVEIARTPKLSRLVVRDTGVGIESDDMRRLFTEGGKGKDSSKINVDSTGYGLFIAKGVVEAHGGRVWAESEGRGKGPRFPVALTVE